MKTLAAVLLVCIAPQAFAQEYGYPVSSIRVIGNAVVTAKPDRAQIDVGVLTQGPESQQAAAQNAKQLDAVNAALRKVLGPDADIKTIRYSLNPNYQYQPDGGQPTIFGYVATNLVRVTVDDLTKVSTVIDAATQAGANHVESVRFMVRDQDAVRSQALREAASRAKAEGDVLASALNLRIRRILSVEDSRASAGTSDDVPVAAIRAADAGGAPAPIEPDGIQVDASVTLTLEVVPR
jgi:uncharacterized protein YggE